MTQITEPEAEVKFFEASGKIYPKAIQGKFRRLKWLAMLVTLAIYYLAPFLRYHRGSHAPDQAILIDLPSRRAYWFFIEIWPQEVYYLTAILIFAAVMLFFATSLFGRVWCGYFCPQTVWTDLFVKVEHLVQGDRIARQRLDQSPWTFEKVWKKLLTHIIWILIGLCTAGAFVFYFNDAPTLWGDILNLNVSPTVLTFIGGLTFSTYLMAGYAREQVCIYMCPYSRFQSGMFDPDTYIISYDAARGEPRGKHKKGESWDGRGHCINCTACVQVCPMGIDIRDGLQIECIACGLCIDACDEIMDKMELPRGLVRYDTERNATCRAKGESEKIRLVRPRTLYYTLILAVLAIVVARAVWLRQPTELHVLHDRNPLFVLLSNGDIRNGYDVKILNKNHDHRLYALSVKGLKGAALTFEKVGHQSLDKILVPADRVYDMRIYVTAPAQESAQKDVTFLLKDVKSKTETVNQSVFISSGE